ncbi:PDDEXK nuclease domain-containing protein [Phormidesmis sp. 146-12]
MFADNCADDKPTIGIILCKGRKMTAAEYALRDVNKPIGISTYQLKGSLPEPFQQSLPSIEQLEMKLDTIAAAVVSEEDTDA